ncbi:MFS transporter [Sneathiella sp.]|uniref:MFS transporter n=1 Tax=Sneathiella sp. TaxID=1964365 RepID=UPI00263022CF|nr:MFS transporter [Sneathiella sp.]MDF2366406.1 MFS transporter [Sneathiella sp.]
MGPGPESDSQVRVILAGLVGNVMEWYDFAIYGYFAVTIGNLFFPSDDPAVSLLSSFGAFAAGFLARPLGGIVFGRIGDIIGRKRVLTLSVLAMAIPTTLIAFLPTYETIGIAAPILIILLRIIQGLSVGGEYTSSVVFLVERAPPRRRAFFAIWGVWGAVLGVMMGSAVGDAISTILSDAEMADWGWRIPFLFGSLVAITSLLVRRTITTDEGAGEGASPVISTFSKHSLTVVKVAALNVGQAVAFYAVFVYVVTYVKEIDHLPSATALDLNTGSMSLLLVLLPIAAWFSDVFGRRPMMITGALIMTAGAVPLFLLIHSTNPLFIFLGEVGFAVGLSVFIGGLCAANVELLPTHVRCTGLAFAYNASIGVFGGLTPLIVTWLLTATGDPISPAYWIAAAGAISLITSAFFYRDTRDTELEASSP